MTEALRDRLRPAVLRARNERRLLPVRLAARRELSPPLPSAYAYYGDGAVIVPPARVTRPGCISVGEGVEVLEGAWLDVTSPTARLSIGPGTHIGRNAHIVCAGHIVIGADVLTAGHIFITDTEPGIDGPVTIGRGAFLGIRCVVRPGVTIGENAYIGAAAVVDRDVPPRTVVVGNPGRPVKAWDEDRGAWQSVSGWEDLA